MRGPARRDQVGDIPRAVDVEPGHHLLAATPTAPAAAPVGSGCPDPTAGAAWPCPRPPAAARRCRARPGAAPGRPGPGPGPARGRRRPAVAVPAQPGHWSQPGPRSRRAAPSTKVVVGVRVGVGTWVGWGQAVAVGLGDGGSGPRRRRHPPVPGGGEVGAQPGLVGEHPRTGRAVQAPVQAGQDRWGVLGDDQGVPLAAGGGSRRRSGPRCPPPTPSARPTGRSGSSTGPPVSCRAGRRALG